MATQTVYFNNPADITNLQTDVNTLQSTQMNLVGRFRVQWAGNHYFNYATTGTYKNETWTNAFVNLSGNRYVTGNQNPLATPLTIRSFKKSAVVKLPYETPTSAQPSGLVTDESYLYCVIKDRLALAGDFSNQAMLAAWSNYLGGYAILDINSAGHINYICKFDKWTLKLLAIRSIGSYVSVYSTAYMTGAQGRYRGTRGPLALSQDAIFIPTGWAYDDTVAVLKIYKSDLSLAWAWEPPKFLNNRPYYFYGATLTHTIHIPATGTRANDMVITSANSNWQYDNLFGSNLWSNSLAVAGLVPANQNADPILDMIKFTPGIVNDDGRVWGITDFGTYCNTSLDNENADTSTWVFDSAASQLVAGNYYTSDSIIPGTDRTYLWYNLWNTGARGAIIQEATPGSNSSGSDDYDTRGLAYTGNNGVAYKGNWLFYNYTGILVDPFRAPGNPYGTYFENGIAFFDLLDADNQPQLHTDALGRKMFNSTGTYRGYLMTGIFRGPFTTGPSNGLTTNFIVGSYNHLFSQPCPVGFIGAEGFSQPSMIIDRGLPINVLGGVLENQPIVKRLFTGAKDKYMLDRYDAHHLNYFGGSIYGGFCYDPVYDSIYVGTCQGQWQPLDDMLAAIYTPYFNSTWANAIGDLNANAGCLNDNLANVAYLLRAYNLQRGTPAETGALQIYQLALADFEARNNARLNAVRSPRGNRFLCNTLLSLSVATGTINWGHKMIQGDVFDWGAPMLRVSSIWFNDNAYNNDTQSVCLLDSSLLAQQYALELIPRNTYGTTNGRLIAATTKMGVHFFDPDAPSLGGYTGVENNLNHTSASRRELFGMLTTNKTGGIDNLPLRGKHISTTWLLNGGAPYFSWNNGASNGPLFATLGAAQPVCTVVPQTIPGSSKNITATYSGQLLNQPITDPETNQTVVLKNCTSYFEIFNLLTQGTSAVYMSGANPAGTGCVPSRVRVIPVAQDLDPISTGQRWGMTLYGNTLLTNGIGHGAIIGYDINTGDEVYRDYMPFATAMPIVANDTIYVGGLGNPVPGLDPISVDDKGTYGGGLANAPNHILALTPMGI